MMKATITLYIDGKECYVNLQDVENMEDIDLKPVYKHNLMKFIQGYKTTICIEIERNDKK